MENIKWDKFLDNAVSNIRDQKIKEEVREELLDHLEDRKGRFMRFGDSEDEAEKKSLETMGDCVKLKNQLGEIHTRCYVDDLSRALLKILVGFILSYSNIYIFNLSFFSLLSMIGAILIFAGSFQLRNCNSTLKKAWRWSLVTALWDIFVGFSGAIPYFMHLESGDKIIFTVICYTVTAIRAVLLFLGIEKLCAEAVGETGNAPKMKKTIVAYIISQVITLFAFASEEMFLFIYSIPLFIYVLHTLRCEIALINFKEYRTEKIELFGKKGYAILSGFVGLFVVSTLIACAVYAMPPINGSTSTEYHSEEWKAEIKEIRKELIKNGFPEEVAEILPDTEISKCYPLDPKGKIVAQKLENVQNNIDIYTVAVPIMKDENSTNGENGAARYIQTFKYLNKDDISGYSDTFVSNAAVMPIRYSDTYDIFYKKDGVLHHVKPKYLYTSNQDTVNGMYFRTVKGADEMYGFMAVTSFTPNGGKYSTITSYSSQKSFLNYPHYCAFDEIQEHSSFAEPMMLKNNNQWFLSRKSCLVDNLWSSGIFYDMYPLPENQ